MAKGGKRPGAGRPAGTLGKVTIDVREAMADFARRHVDQVSGWLMEVEDPGKRLDLYLRALEYHVPKLGRTEHTGHGGGPIVVNIGREDGRIL